MLVKGGGGDINDLLSYIDYLRENHKLYWYGGIFTRFDVISKSLKKYSSEDDVKKILDKCDLSRPMRIFYDKVVSFATLQQKTSWFNAGGR